MFNSCKLNEKGKLFKNFFAYNLTAILLFSAYDAVANISSVLNQNESIGLTSQSIIYTTQFLTALVWPQVIIEMVGFKFALLISELCYLAFFCANIYPSWATLIPSLNKKLYYLKQNKKKFFKLSICASWIWQRLILDKFGHLLYIPEQTICCSEQSHFHQCPNSFVWHVWKHIFNK